MLNFLFRIAYSIMKCTLGGIILIGLLFLGGLLLFWLFDFSSIEGWIPINNRRWRWNITGKVGY